MLLSQPYESEYPNANRISTRLATKYIVVASLGDDLRLWESWRTHEYSSAVLTYDNILTINVEIEKIWKQRITALTVLWVLVRSYVILENIVINAIQNRWWFYGAGVVTTIGSRLDMPSLVLS